MVHVSTKIQTSRHIKVAYPIIKNRITPINMYYTLQRAAAIHKIGRIDILKHQN
jgi:hypothetical protein